MPMAIIGVCRPFFDCWDSFSERFYERFPCLSDPAKRTSWGLKIIFMLLHLAILGYLFFLDNEFLVKRGTKLWSMVLYLIMFFLALILYFFTSCSSPGYVLDAMSAENEGHAVLRMSQNSRQPASSQYLPDANFSWENHVLNLYLPIPSGYSQRNWTCSYCRIAQPPRSKHCHDCDKCVLRFDHHCIWLGTCIGQNNHCRFWWFLLGESIISCWTFVLYIMSLRSDISHSWWMIAIAILLLIFLFLCMIFLVLLLVFHSYLILTNQTTYELVRRRRLLFPRHIPDRVFPFSRGICKNIYNFCCVSVNTYYLEPLPTQEEINQRARPYTFGDIISCRCC